MVQVRSPITCKTRYGVCATCYGRDLARGRHDQHRRSGRRHGRAVDRRAGHAAHDAYVPHRWCGIASRCGVVARSRNKGTLRFHNVKTVQHEKGHLVAVSRSGEIGVVDEFGRERERYKIPYGAHDHCRRKATRSWRGQVVATWDPHTHPVVTEVARSSSSSRTSSTASPSPRRWTKSRACPRPWCSIPSSAAARTCVRPCKLLNAKGKEVDLRQHRDPGRVHAAPGRARQPRGRRARCRSATSSRASRRNPRRPATSPAVCRASRTCSKPASRRTRRSSPRSRGTVSFGKETKGKRRLVITGDDGEKYEELIPKWRQLNVFEGEGVDARRSDRRRRAEPARHPAPAGRRVAGQLPGARDPGRLPPAGREDQRQAHRGDHPPDAAQDRGARDRRHRPTCAGEQLDRARALDDERAR